MFKQLDRRYLSVLANYLLVGICELIDTAFSNRISLDTICVMSAYFTVITCALVIYQVGSYAYRVLKSNEKYCLAIGFITSCIEGILIFIFADNIASVFSFTDFQMELLAKCLRIYAVSIGLFQIGDFTYGYSLLNSKNMEMLVCNIIYYILLIGTDVLVVVFHGGLAELILCTSLSYAVYDPFVVILSGILKSNEKYRKGLVKDILKHGINTCIGRIADRLSNLVYNMLISSLGTEMYAIHGVCRSIASFTEHFTNGFYTYLMVDICQVENVKERLSRCYELIKEKFTVTIIMCYTFCFVMLIAIHGKVKLIDCLPYVGLYCLQFIPTIFYETLKAYLSTVKKSKYFIFAGLIGLLTEPIVCFIAIKTGLDLWLISLVISIDIGCRALFYIKCARDFAEKNA